MPSCYLINMSGNHRLLCASSTNILIRFCPSSGGVNCTNKCRKKTLRFLLWYTWWSHDILGLQWTYVEDSIRGTGKSHLQSGVPPCIPEIDQHGVVHTQLTHFDPEHIHAQFYFSWAVLTGREHLVVSWEIDKRQIYQNTKANANYQVLCPNNRSRLYRTCSSHFLSVSFISACFALCNIWVAFLCHQYKSCAQTLCLLNSYSMTVPCQLFVPGCEGN